MKSLSKIGYVLAVLMPLVGQGESVAEAKAASEKSDSAAHFRYAEMLCVGRSVK